MQILDIDKIDFFWEKLSNCSLWDAYKILSCQKKALFPNEKAFLVKKDRLNIWGKSNFYIQKIILPENLSRAENFFLAENVVEALCNEISRIDEQTWWIYAANHSSGCLRIIAGLGKGIILSRFLSVDSDISSEISKTIMYLQRFGMDKHIKFFSPFGGVKVHSKIGPEIICEQISM
ncbi:MAG: hypothetical protein LBF44_03370, partial [Holosporaceae bacterium]|nr:hypothetical protein [Holosporaceae bacterium]